jgi:hypothetical protein
LIYVSRFRVGCCFFFSIQCPTRGTWWPTSKTLTAAAIAHDLNNTAIIMLLVGLESSMWTREMHDLKQFTVAPAAA